MTMLPSGLFACSHPGCPRTVNIHRYTWEGAQDAGWYLSPDGPVGVEAPDWCPEHNKETQ